MWTNELLSNIYTQIIVRTKEIVGDDEEYKTIHFTTEQSNDGKPKFPTVLIEEVPSNEIGTTLEGNEVAGVVSVIQVTVSDNESQYTANKVADYVMDAMKQLRYTVIGTPKRARNGDIRSNYCRYRRPIGYSDKW